ncbi:MAG: hypothetical protein V1704_04655 [Candidatus Vogelbacteria bacterium]
MRVISVIPIAKGILRDELTYFTGSPLKPGAIVLVPLRGRSVPALVTSVREADELKLTIKNAAFALKKIIRVKHEHFFIKPFMEAARLAADYSAAPLGAALKTLVPSTILGAKLTLPKLETVNLDRPQGERFVLQEPDDERRTYYKSLIRAEFAKQGSVFLCLPTTIDIVRTLASLERGISEYTIVLHHQLSTRDLIRAWQKALDLAHPVLIIATPIFLSLPRADIRMIIIDRENTQTYKSVQRPFLDYRRFAEYLAEKLRATFILGDAVLRTETCYRADQGELEPLASLKHHAASNAVQKLIAVTKVPTADFRVVSDELLNTIGEAQKRNEKIFLFTHRRGLAPVVICQDCGYTVECDNCEAPTVLHLASPASGSASSATGEADGAQTIFICHRCGARRSAAEKCRHCGGWRLLELGIGIDRVARELLEKFPSLKLLKLDSDSVRGGAQPIAVVKRFLTTPGSVLLGTELALHYLEERIENVAIVALDSLFALPDYRINEKVFSLLIRLRSLAGRQFIIQTRNVKVSLFEKALKGNLLDFYRAEIAERKKYGYPPFQTFIKIARQGERAAVRLEMKALADGLVSYEPEVFPAFVPVVGGEYRLHLLLKRQPANWPEPNLLSRLKSLPPTFVVDVDPDSLL